MKTKIANYSFLRRNLFSDDLIDAKCDSHEQSWNGEDMARLASSRTAAAQPRNNERKLG